MIQSKRWTTAWITFALLALVALLLAPGGNIAAAVKRQETGPLWSEPRNLSRSGAAAQPVILAGGAEGTARVFWWDQFDGLTTTSYDGETWSEPAAAPIRITEAVGEEFVSRPIGAMPQIVGDAGGQAHAWWIGAPDKETDIRPLLHSRLAPGSTAWSSPATAAEGAVAWQMAAAPDGTLHLLYLRTLHTAATPAGVYHRRSTNGGASWSPPTLLYETIYFRLLTAEQAYLAVSAGGEEQVYATWDDPRLGRAFYARSTDGGATWDEPREIGDAESGAQHAHVIPTGDGALLLWEATRAAAACALYRQHSVDGVSWDAPVRVLETLQACPQAPRFWTTSDGGALMIAGGGSGSLTLVAWSAARAQWSEPAYLGFSFEDPAPGRRVYLDALRIAPVGERLAVVGLGQEGDVWFQESAFDAPAWAFAPPSPWSATAAVPSDGVPALPAVAVDVEGRAHLLWSTATAEGEEGAALVYARLEIASDGEPRWTRPAEVLRSEGRAGQPALAAAGDFLHAVWSGGPDGAAYYSRAYTRDAYASDSWSEPRLLPREGATAGSAPAILADGAGTLHVVYAAPLNEGRGIYYTRSDDSGESWAAAAQLCDAVGAGWAMVDHPALAVDAAGTLHVAWTRGSSAGPFAPQGIYYARSFDGGKSWSKPQQMVEGRVDWPRLAATPAGVHLLWAELAGRHAWTERISPDGGATWGYQQRISGLGEAPGPVGLAADGVGALHLVSLTRDDDGAPLLHYTIWAEGRWSAPETLRLEREARTEPGVAVALAGAQGRLDVAFVGEDSGEGEAAQMGVVHVSRTAPVVEPGSAAAPAWPTPTPTPGPTPTPTPTPRPTVNPGVPPDAPPALELGPLMLPATAIAGLLVAAIIVTGAVALRAVGARRR